MSQALRVESKNQKASPRVDLPILNSIEKAVIATDLAGHIVFWNRAAEQLYGWTWEEVIGRSITDLVVPDSAQPDAARIMELLQRGETWTGPFRLRRRDGSEFTGIVTDEPMRDSNGNLVGIIGISHPKNDTESLGSNGL